ncbi:MAG: cupin domain-containing protein [Candidatus Acidiferrales bacterium]
MSDAEFFELSELRRRQTAAGKSYFEFLRNAAMSAGVYVVSPGGSDTQTPHREDELYYVVRGRARMRAGAEERVVNTGSVIYVAAGVEHRFHDVEEELTVLVFFAPPES